MTQQLDTDDTWRHVSSGLAGLDAVLDGLRIGDNVVWRISDLSDYQRYANAFVNSSAAAGRRIIYLRFGAHAPLFEASEHIQLVTLDAQSGFESFTAQAWRQIEQHGRGAFYVCDCLSDLLDAWATDAMVGNFFRVVCPFLFELDTVAWFALYPQRHSRTTLDRIRRTTQVLIDARRVADALHIQPIKVWRRQSPTMFLPHRAVDDDFIPITDSRDATYLQWRLEQLQPQSPRLLDYWDRLFMQATDALMQQDDGLVATLQDRVLRVMISRDERMLSLARQYLDLSTLIEIRRHMIGSGHVGGKTTGMLLARQILLSQHSMPWQRYLAPHDSCYLGSDAYYAFLVHNALWPAFMQQRSEAGYLDAAPALRQGILAGQFPEEIRAELLRWLDHYGQYPLLVRSSSLLEDSFSNAFAGKYDSVFLINQGAPEQRLEALEDAIRRVYASTMSEDALHYRQQRGLQHQEEPMALLIQRVNGRFHGRYYLPDAAGVGVSRNTFAWDPDMDAEAGMVRLVMGLGTRAVDRIEGDHACVMALDLPTRQPYRSSDEAYRHCQQQLDVIDVAGEGLCTLPLTTLLAAQLPDFEHSLPLFAEQDREAGSRARELGLPTPVWRLTFRPLVRDTSFTQRLRDMMNCLEAAYQHPVDIEFTLHLDAEGEAHLNLVQCRPLATLGTSSAVELPHALPDDRILFRSEGHFMGGNIDLHIDRIIRVDATAYAGLSRSQKYELARLIGKQVRALKSAAQEPQRIMLIGPGRWGTGSPELGVPVRFADIAGISVLVEVAEKAQDMVPDLSYGSHFFQDLVETGIAYVALLPDTDFCDYHPQQLQSVDSTSWQPETEDPALAAALHCHRPAAGSLRLVADVVQQRLVCHFLS